MQNEKQILEFMQKEWLRMRKVNPSFSLRAFARRLGMPASSISEILSGKHRITRRAASKILFRLPVTPGQRENLLEGLQNKISSNKSSEAKGRVLQFSQVDMDQYHLISDWFYFGILSLAETEDFKSDPSWIAARLGINKRQARVALNRLERLGMLARNNDGTRCPSGKQFQTTSGVPNVYLRRSHLQNLSLAEASLEKDAIDDCDFTAMTMAIDPAKLPEAKKRITEFRRSLCAYLESGKKKEVFRLAVQLFPLSKRSSS